ncbi:transient receptor potential cation channel subfamily V member 4-like [Ruditapes philippinarum]|uniref:transient receptor potential cation channel subfamily V member 4-like n=1 Tax=Ruditapes philippinarum TaxID=129788 RepID=UPI00295C2CF3|nr:transient receptor potential cation channel subfamily V member 4-like [Ruditapes philippinarum]
MLPEGYEKKICAKGPVFQDTVMMAGTPLGVAALKFNKNIFNIVLRVFATDLDVMNSNRDNIIHSLIKYAHIQPEKLNKVVEMISYVIDCKFVNDSTCGYEDKRRRKLREKSRKLLMMTNKDEMNPLQLAGKRQQFQIFDLIMQNEVYRSTESGDGFFNEESYDITEIETLKLKREEINSKNLEDDIRPEHHESILEYLVHQETKTAFLFVDCLPIKEVIREKWKFYRWVFLSWFVFHLVFMVVLSVAAVYRSKVKAPVSRNTKIEFTYVVTHDTFVSVVSVVGLVFGLLYLMMEISRVLISRFLYRPSSNLLKRVLRNISSPYSNQIFRIYFTLFSLLLILDCVIAATEASGSFSGYENYCLIFVVIIGWYLTLFFLQTFKAFSIFSVLIQRAIVDMLKFALVMTFLLVAFSVAMYMIMQGVETDEDDFDFFSTTLFKMLTIMLGIGELGVLFQARQPYLAIFVFVLFVLLTTILLLNALIAIMSNSCTDLMSNYGGEVAAKLHCRLQKLSAILFLEGCFPNFLCKEVGVEKRKHRYHNNEWEKNVLRRIWMRTSVHKHNRAKDTEKATHILNNTSPNEGVVSMIMQNLNPYLESLKLPDSKVTPVNTTTHFINEPEVNTVEGENSDTVAICRTCKREIEVTSSLFTPMSTRH